MLGLASSACGAKTGLAQPCEIPLTHSRADVVLVLDHSGSMDNPVAPGAETSWEILTDTLAAVLPPFDDALSLGMLTYPVRPINMQSDYCAVASTLNVGVQPSGVSATLGGLGAVGVPLGETPTFDALRTAGNALRSRSTSGTPQFIVLGTDGWPNCNPTLAGAACHCPTSISCDGGVACLDTDRVEAELASLAREGIYTFIIGIELVQSNLQPILETALNQMAVAGGEAIEVGAVRYQRGTDSSSLRDTFEGVLGPLAFCRLRATVSRFDLHNASLHVRGAPTPPRDPDHVDGWDWTDISRGELRIYGASCAQIVHARAVVSLVTDTPLCLQ